MNSVQNDNSITIPFAGKRSGKGVKDCLSGRSDIDTKEHVLGMAVTNHAAFIGTYTRNVDRRYINFSNLMRVRRDEGQGMRQRTCSEGGWLAIRTVGRPGARVLRACKWSQ